jgi:probable F420-dependent oxidoreductase
MRPFRFGVLNETVLPAAAWLAHVRRAEQLGYDTFLIRDHFVPDYFGDQLGPIAALAAAAGATTRLRLGTMVFDNDYRHPVVLAKEAATLDVLSGGRLELGIGAGWLRVEYEQAGIPFDPPGRRIARLEEALRVLKGLFADRPLTFAGEHYRIDGLDGFPKPAQRPHPPILIGGGQRRMLTLAGREADIVGILTSSVRHGTLDADPAERLAGAVDEKVGWVRAGAGTRFDQIELSLIPTVLLTDDRERRAAELLAEHAWPDITIADVLEMPSLFIGTVEQIVDDMQRRCERFGFTYYVVSDQMMEAFAPVVGRLGSASSQAT